MALQFQGAPDWLIQEYMNQKTPYQEASAGIQTAVKTYLDLNENKRRNRELANESARRDQETAMKGREQFYNYNDTQSLPLEIQSQLGRPAEGPVTQEGQTAHILPSIQELNDFRARYPQGLKGAMADRERVEKAVEPPLPVDKYSALQSGKAEDLGVAFPGGIPSKYVGPALMSTSRNTRVMSDPFGNPVRVPVAGGAATPVQMPTNNLNPLQQKLNPMEYKDWTKEVNDFDADPVVKADRTILANLNQIENEMSKYNAALTGPLKSQQARAIAREVGALTDSDIARQSLDPSLLGRFKSFVSVAATGEIPEDQLNLLRESVSTIKQSALSRVSSVATDRATRKSTLYGGKVAPEELVQSLRLPTNFSSSMDVSKSTGTAGGLDPAKKARLEELRAKKAAGTLGR